jgi:hypothetical protein
LPDLEVEFLESTVSIDLLESESYPTVYGSRRAAVGDRFLTLETRVLNEAAHAAGREGPTSTAPLCASTSMMSLGPRSPGSTRRSPSTRPKDLIWHFNYPADADRLRILFGSEEAEPLW